MKRFKDFITENDLHIFDIDDTLFHTSAKIHVKKDGMVVQSLPSADLAGHKLPKNHEYDYSEFHSASKFKESKPIPKMVSKLLDIHNKVKKSGRGKVIMNTARQDLDDKDSFLSTFKKHGIDVDNIHIHRAGNIKGISSGEAKNQILKKHIESGKYTGVHMYDDSTHNLYHFLELGKEHPHIDFNAHHVQPDGTTKKYK